MSKKTKKYRPGKKLRLSRRTIDAAKLVGMGKTQAEAASELGITQQAVSKAVGLVQNRLPENDYEEVSRLRAISLARLNKYRLPLCRIAGVYDAENLDGRVPPPKPVATAGRQMTDEEWRDYADTCKAQGFDVHGNPLTDADVGVQIAAIRALLDIEHRIARLLGTDAPRITATLTGNYSGPQMSDEQFVAEMREMGLEPPPGIVEELAAKGKDPNIPTRRVPSSVRAGVM